ncbi:MAG: alpha/beta hydrolase [Chthonomonadaceae bacterium]|nr:alpha/beta hydrolase [Chthonomonadaceae bacterium]
MNGAVEITLDNAETRRLAIFTFTVPANHDAPGDGTLRLAYHRICSPFPRRTPVVFLCGGPGDPGIASLRHGPFRKAFERMAQSRDVILLDQRGCGYSDQDMRCAPPDFRDGWLRDETTALAMLADQAARTLQSRPIRPEWYTPAQSARDLTFLADALGVDQVHLWGYSYGTHLTQAALKQLPERIDRVILCGFEGPDQTYKLPSRIQQQIERLDHLARSQNVLPDLMDVMDRVHRRLATESVTVQQEGRPAEVGLFGLQWIMSTWVGVSNRFTRLPALYAALDRGDSRPLERAVQGFAKMLVQRPAVFYLKDAASGATTARMERIAQERSTCLLADRCNFPFPQIREAWGQQDLGDAFRAPLQTEHSLFILTGSLDGFTPTENAQESLATLPNATLSVINNAAHNDLLTCEEAVEDMVYFLEGHPVSRRKYTLPAPALIPE